MMPLGPVGLAHGSNWSLLPGAEGEPGLESGWGMADPAMDGPQTEHGSLYKVANPTPIKMTQQPPPSRGSLPHARQATCFMDTSTCELLKVWTFTAEQVKAQ